MSLPERIADKYDVRGVLGEGGTGIVYDAVRIADGKSVALKVMHPQYAGDPQIRGRFQREAAILRRLEGPHVCPILDFGEVGDDDKRVVYLALPRIEGPSLEALMKEGPLPLDRALDVLIQVCVALRSAHAQGVIHRDLKPANVLLEGGEKVVVVDFGMSKIVTGQGTGTTGLTAHNMLFGTPEYMSPEQARGDDLDARCDVYAVGVMLYEMLTGAHPFSGATPLVVLTAHLTADLEPPSKRATGAWSGRVTPALEAVVMHALARDRDQRYATAAALSSAILHARAEPTDIASVNPEAFATHPAGSIAFARTVPAASPRAVVQTDENASPQSATMRSNAPPPVRSAPKLPESSTPPLEPKPAAASDRVWILIWVLAAAASIALGVYFALR